MKATENLGRFGEARSTPGRTGGRFSGARALVTGAGSGIGAAIVRVLLAESAIVYGLDRDGEALERTAASFDGRGFTALVGDVDDAADRERAVRSVAGITGKLDLLINNAGVFIPGGADARAEDWQRTLDVNVRAPAELTASATGALVASRRAAVVNVASISGHVAQAGRWAYNASKGAVLSLTRCQALDLAPHGIRVNSVSPGWIWTEAIDRMAAGDRARWEPAWGEFHMLGRCGEPEEVAQAVAFLASAQASFITGVDLPVDGGYLAMGPERGYALAAPPAADGPGSAA